ncbi:hypothetical protein MMC17_007282 [Xylographa soralifera]|nr:hypothetical protein [Xylographa soralifera]
MDGVHGVDISWLHHSQKDHHAKSAVSSLPNGRERSSSDASEIEENIPTTPQTNGDASPQSRHAAHRPHIHHRQSSEKGIVSAQPPPPSPREPKQQATPTLGRKASWITNISSKFSSSTSSQPASPTAQSQATKPLPSPQREQPNPLGASPSSPKDVKKADTAVQQPPSSPKSGGTSFLSSAFRRLSASGGSVGLGKGAGSGPACQRRVMNVDPYRERCKIQELHPAKLRRVAFSVDVEIAGTARYLDEDTEDNVDMPPSSPGRAPSLTPTTDKQVDSKKQKDKKIKERMEGEALKHPQAVMDKKESSSDPIITNEEVSLDQVAKDLPSSNAVNDETKDPSRKKEKKKRSEEERKQRKERKRQEAVANGTIPVELSRSSSSTGSSSHSRSHSKAQDRPTTDPLRIYRRCCQLRETPILKRITEQLAPPSACDPGSPGTISCLDLSGYWMQLQDIVTLGDYLAVVPVRKLILENCGLTDEALRVILAGLLAAKTPDQARHNKHLAKNSNGHPKEAAEKLGVIEKLSLKNNPVIGKDGWKYIGLFIHMSRSLKAIDLSLIPLPQKLKSPGSPNSHLKPLGTAKDGENVCITLQKALAERLAGPRLEELVMAECGLGSDDIERIVDGVIQSGATRLGLAGNKISDEALHSIARYVETGKCEGLDLGGNDLSSNLNILADALGDQNALYALSLADCNLSMSSLKTLFPALIRLPNFRFIDLSHNRNLFAARPNALGCLRKFLPQMAFLKRIHLADVSMSSEQAIAIAEVLPEMPVLAHLNILENPELTALASAKDEASQEEACALYTSLMAAVRVSDSIICVDIDVPSQDSSEIVKALAKQVVAYCLRNMERGPAAEVYEDAAASIAGPHGGEKYVAVPDILLHLVGHVDGFPENHDDDEPAPDDDYIVGGTGVVKALGIVLGNRADDHRRPSRDVTPTESGTVTPKQSIQGVEVAKGKAKNMSKNLLESARKIRMRLQPALVREQRNDNDGAYSEFFQASLRVSANLFLERLLFLDSTLERMIQRFEDEFPECRLRPLKPSPSVDDTLSESGSLPSSFTNPFNSEGTDETSLTTVDPTEDDEKVVRVPMSRQHSDVSLASRFLTQEEGQMHRFGQQIRRDILRPELQDFAHGTTGTEVEPQHLQKLRQRLEAMDGAEIKDRVALLGSEAVLRELGATAEELLFLEQQDPEGFEKFKEAYIVGQQNQRDNLRGSSETVV